MYIDCTVAKLRLRSALKNFLARNVALQFLGRIGHIIEAVDAENRTIKLKDRPLNWGGTTQLCTRESKFEINEQGDCATRGLAVTGFAAVDMSAGGKTLRLAMP